MAIDPPELLMTLSTLATGSMGCAFTPMFLGMAYFPWDDKSRCTIRRYLGCRELCWLGTSTLPGRTPLGFHVIGWGLILGTLVTIVVSKLTKHSQEEVIEPFYTDGMVIEVEKG